MSSGSGVKNNAFRDEGVANNNAAAQYANLAPQFAQFATGTDGMTPQQKADLQTASGQALGGATAAITGQGALQETRTGNSGSFASIADAAMRNAQQVQSGNDLNVQNQSDELARQRQIEGLTGEQNLFNTENGSAMNYLQIANAAKPSFWQQLGTTAANGAVNAAIGAAGA